MGKGEPSPGADVGRGEPSPGADVGRCEPSPGARRRLEVRAQDGKGGVEGVSPVPAQARDGRGHYRRRSGSGGGQLNKGPTTAECESGRRAHPWFHLLCSSRVLNAGALSTCAALRAAHAARCMAVAACLEVRYRAAWDTMLDAVGYRAVRDTVPCEIPCRAGYRAVRDTMLCGIPCRARYRAVRDTMPCAIPCCMGYCAVRDIVPCGIP